MSGLVAVLGYCSAYTLDAVYVLAGESKWGEACALELESAAIALSV